MKKNKFIKNNKDSQIKKISKYYFSLCAFCLLIFLNACSGTPSILEMDYPVGSIWDAPDFDDNGEVEWDDADMVAKEQHKGYLYAKDALELVLLGDWISGEGNRQEDVQVAIRNMVEDEDEDDGNSNPVVAVMGATSNEATMRAAAVVNFFHVPMIVPSANGDRLFPSNNLWAFRLSAPGSAYANYLLGTIISELISSGKLETTASIANLKIAILYEANTFGESAAVATAEAAMAQSIEIGLYKKFSAENPDPESLIALIDEIYDEGKDGNGKEINLVYLVSSDPGIANTFIQLFNTKYSEDTMPILVGQAGGFASLDFLTSVEAESIFILRQEIVEDNCPVDSTSIFEAQTYAAAFLLDRAIELANEKPASIVNGNVGVSLGLSEVNQLTLFRESVRDVLKEFNEMVPCIGRVAFENSGEIKSPQFEILIVENGKIIVFPAEEFLDALAEKLE